MTLASRGTAKRPSSWTLEGAAIHPDGGSRPLGWWRPRLHSACMAHINSGSSSKVACPIPRSPRRLSRWLRRSYRPSPRKLAAVPAAWEVLAVVRGLSPCRAHGVLWNGGACACGAGGSAKREGRRCAMWSSGQGRVGRRRSVKRLRRKPRCGRLRPSQPARRHARKRSLRGERLVPAWRLRSAPSWRRRPKRPQRQQPQGP